jgi:BirA family biotin operon repressor/biotin-[acetyl-CoA-carboxylase] ligase
MSDSFVPPPSPPQPQPPNRPGGARAADDVPVPASGRATDRGAAAAADAVRDHAGADDAAELPLPAAWAADAARRIDRSRLIELLDPEPSRWGVEVIYETGSTNADLLARLKETRAPRFEPCVRVAYSQTAGRGRRGRTWLAQPGDALLFSIGYALQGGPEKLAGLSLALGTAIVDGLRVLPLDAEAKLALKWPNDVLLNGAKVSGVLVETAWTTPHACALVVGIGINVLGADALRQQLAAFEREQQRERYDAGHASEARAPSKLPSKLPAAAASTLPGALSDAWQGAALTPTLAAVINAVAVALKRFERHGFARYRDAWLADHAYTGKEIVVLEHDAEKLRGIACGVDLQGQLLVRTADGEIPVPTGDVSLRLAGDARR